MSVGVAVLVFLACLIMTLVSSEVLVRGLVALGTKLKLTEGFLGLLMALGRIASDPGKTWDEAKEQATKDE